MQNRLRTSAIVACLAVVLGGTAYAQLVAAPAVASAVPNSTSAATGCASVTTWSAPSAVTSASLALIALLSLSFSFYQFIKGRIDNDEWKRREIHAARRLKLLEALLWFESHPPQRSAALAVVEGHWHEYADLHNTWIPVLVSQAVSVICKSDTSLATRDHVDLQRILELLHRYLAGAPGSSVDHNLSISPVLSALDDLPSKIVVTSDGSRLGPDSRQRFIVEVLSLTRQYPEFSKH